MIVLLKPDEAWQGLLGQSGVPFKVGSPTREDSVVIASAGVPATDVPAALASAAPGCALLAEGPAALKMLGRVRFRRTRLSRLLPDEHEVFRGVGELSAACAGWQVPGANAGLRPGGRLALLAQAFGEHPIVVLPFRLRDIVAIGPPAPRAFEADTSRPVVERVALRSRGEARRLVEGALRWLLGLQSLPLVRLASCPGRARSAFGFRVDTDYCGVEELTATGRLASTAGMSFTWFINTEAHGPLLDGLTPVFAGQDIQVHCHQHRVYRSEAANRANIQKALAVLRANGYQPRGAAAPFGDWNPAWDRALAVLGFEYSSDFAAGYDDLPFRPAVDGRPSRVLQVPVHPVCLGRLLASRAGEDAIRRYFHAVVLRQAARGEPCFLYGHPTRICEYPDLTLDIVNATLAISEAKLTLTEYADWWRRRERVRWAARCTGDSLELAVEQGEDDVMVELQRSGRTARLPLRSGRHLLSGLDWQPAPAWPTPAGIPTGLPLRARVSEWRRRLRRQTRA